MNFSDATTVKDGQTVSMSAARATSITMIGANRQALAVPSTAGSDGESFSVSRTSATAASPLGATSRTGRVVLGP